MKRTLTPIRLALRELRRGRRKFVFFVLCIAVGVAGLVGVKGFNASLQGAMLAEARTLMAADMTLSMSQPADEAEQKVLDSLAARGIAVAQNIETVSMGINPANKESVLVELKAAGQGYPFYGALELDPPNARLTDETVLVGQDLLDKLGLEAGSKMRLGSAEFSVAGVILKEPDRVTAGFSMGPRVMVTVGGLERAELLRLGSRVRHIYLFKLATDEQVGQVRSELTAAFSKDRPRIADFREANPQVRRFLDRMTSFLSLVSLVALLVGGLGVANATRAYVQQKMDTIAIMKCVGATTGRIIAVFLTQMLLLSLAGSLLGVAFGYAVQLIMPRVVGPLLNLDITLTLSPVVAAQGLLVGLTTAILFTLLPLAAIADVKPALVFRREMAENRPRPSSQRLMRTAFTLAAIGGGLVAISAWISGSVKWGLWFMGGLAAGVLLLMGAAQGLVWLVRRIRVPRSWIVTRQGLASLYRPGSHTGAIVMALGVGITMVLTIYLLQRSLLQEVQITTPANVPNMIFFNVQTPEAAGLHTLLTEHPEVIDAPAPTPTVRGRLISLDGKTRDQLVLTQDEERWFNFQFTTTYSAALPPGNEVVGGRWWTEADWKDRVLVSVEQEAAQRLHLTAGSVMVMDLEGGLQVEAQVFNIRKATDFRAGGNFNFVFAPGGLEGAPLSYGAQARVKPGAAKAVQKAVLSQYPGITVIDLREMLDQVAGILDKIGLVIRFVAGFSVVAGLIILASSIATTKFRRTREAVLYKTLGATRGKVWRIFAVEYAALGLVAGLMSAGLAVAVAWSLLHYIMEVRYVPELAPVAAGVAISIALTIAVGVISTLDVLAAKPLQVLREE